MKDFVQLFRDLDQTNSTIEKVRALAGYFERVEDKEKIWTIALLSHRRPKRPVNTTQMKKLAAERAGIPFWLLDESHHVVGDLAETIARILPRPESPKTHSLDFWIGEILKMQKENENDRHARLLDAWDSMDAEERFVFNKILTGGFRVGVSQKLMVRALGTYTGLEESLLAHRLMGNWDPQKSSFEELILTSDAGEDLSRPYPFFLAYALEGDQAMLGETDGWAAEYKWDGIRGQIIVRGKKIFVWSRGEELVTDKYPEFEVLSESLPDGTVLDGEILPYQKGKILSFQKLQTRIGRKNVTKKILEQIPVVFRAYDLLEWEGRDIRTLPYLERRNKLESLFPASDSVLQLSARISFDSWEKLAALRASAREQQSEGLMLKKKDAPYLDGRRKGAWWKWKMDPFTVDAVLIYAMRGHGRRANLYSDYTFAVWDGEQLVPFTKAYSGLTDSEITQVDRFVKQNTIDRFGPVRSVTPTLVFEIAFEGIAESKRHKSGIALRFPRMKRWRKDKPASEANTLQDLRGMLPD